MCQPHIPSAAAAAWSPADFVCGGAGRDSYRPLPARAAGGEQPRPAPMQARQRVRITGWAHTRHTGVQGTSLQQRHRQMSGVCAMGLRMGWATDQEQRVVGKVGGGVLRGWLARCLCHTLWPGLA